LHPQAGRQIAAEQMLAEMHQLAFEIDPHLAADGAPAVAEGVVLGQIAAGLRMLALLIHRARICAPQNTVMKIHN
jgi:hypothetical protein